MIWALRVWIDPGIRGLEPKPQPVRAHQDMLWTSCTRPAWLPSSYPIPTAPSQSWPLGKPQGGPSGQDWGCWTLRVDLTPPRPLPQWPRAYQGVGCPCSQLPSGLSQEPGHGEDHLGLPECPQAFAYRAPQLGVPPPPTPPSTNVEPSAWPHQTVHIHCYHSPAPVASSQGSLSHGSLSGGFWGSVPVPSSSAYTLLWARG